MEYVNIDTWKRKEHFNFFSKFEEPYFGVTAKVDVSKALQKSRKEGFSFFQYYLHKAVLICNEIENFRYQVVEKNQVVLHDTMGASATVMRANETFGFTYIPFESDFYAFAKAVQKEIERVQSDTSLFPPHGKENVAHYSALPWVDFTAITHSRIFNGQDSVPKFSFGKVTENENIHLMSVAVYVHHGLADGLHVSRFFEGFQRLLNE